MGKRMLVDASHPDETRVAIISGNKLDDYDFELKSRKQLKGNIYLAKVVRVEPSLQAAFVEYGGNRHGFLAFSEIHPDYYRIPVEDREQLLKEMASAPEDQDGEEDGETGEGAGGEAAGNTGTEGFFPPPDVQTEDIPAGAVAAEPVPADMLPQLDNPVAEKVALEEYLPETSGTNGEAVRPDALGGDTPPDALGGDTVEDEETRRKARPWRNYRIQEVIHRRQILLVQVVKEERGNKGAALTTYLSLPGRYCVLMPNTPKGGGISRRITSPQDRRRLKDMVEALGVPDGMAVILRTAGLDKGEADIRRDLEYLLRLWDTVREETLQSTAPKLIYEEANLIKRTIRDTYSSEIDEIIVEGDAAWNAARDFMHMLMPSHARKIHHYREQGLPLFLRYQVEGQIDSIHNPVVQLRSGGYIVINQTEALVAIDVNSGRATREKNIEETALRTNLEAADEAARQIRLRDLAGLIVIDFIDMEEGRHNAAVERRLKEAMKNDRARIQLGRISAFGLLELSRQRLRPSLSEAHFEKCPHCAGTGTLRSAESAAMLALRTLEEEGAKRRSSELTIHIPTRVALCLLNQKRQILVSMEQRYGMRVTVACDDTLVPPNCRVERVGIRDTDTASGPVTGEQVMMSTGLEETAVDTAPVSGEVTEPLGEEEFVEASGVPTAGEGQDMSRRRRGRRGGRRRREHQGDFSREAPSSGQEAAPQPADIDALFEASERVWEQGQEGSQGQQRSRDAGLAHSNGRREHSQEGRHQDGRGPRRGGRRRGPGGRGRHGGPGRPHAHREGGMTERQGHASARDMGAAPSGPPPSAGEGGGNEATPVRKGWWNKLLGN
ncbi:MAG: ribonuclease E/G [Pseudomonadota bacterium]|nr:ribonuclease E/G [Pseudomonadota bacterium]